MGKNFEVIYKILRHLDRFNGDDEISMEAISAKTLGIAEAKWEQILIELQINGYIRGLVYTQTMGDVFPHIVEPIRPRITLKGMEYLEENSFMKKAAGFLKGIKDITPGI